MQEFSFLALIELSEGSPRVIPILIDDSTVPSYLANYLYIDMAKDIDAGLNQLIRSLDIVSRKVPRVRRRININKTKNEPDISGQLDSLREALTNGRLTLVCGAGVSAGAGVPIWNQLLMELLDSVIDQLSKNHSIDLDSNAAKEFYKRYNASSLILGKYLKNNLGKDFGKKVRKAIYTRNPKTCELIDAIIEVARPQRDFKPLDSIITFNFDGLIEENLSKAGIPNRAVHTEAVKHSSNELPIYHVHGYLPRTGRISDETALVFSEDAYHSQFIDAFSWSNLIQLNKLTQNTCLFVGVSLTDPNLRRLLDVAWRKNPDKTLGHYIIKKRPVFEKEINPTATDDLALLLEEQDANTLGINVIWVNDFNEIPNILREIR